MSYQIFVYDAVTTTDVAGNTTEKQNDTCDFTYTVQEVKDTGEVKKIRGLLGISEYQRRMMMQQQRAFQNQ